MCLCLSMNPLSPLVSFSTNLPCFLFVFVYVVYLYLCCLCVVACPWLLSHSGFLPSPSFHVLYLYLYYICICYICVVFVSLLVFDSFSSSGFLPPLPFRMVVFLFVLVFVFVLYLYCICTWFPFLCSGFLPPLYIHIVVFVFVLNLYLSLTPLPPLVSCPNHPSAWLYLYLSLYLYLYLFVLILCLYLSLTPLSRLCFITSIIHPHYCICICPHNFICIVNLFVLDSSPSSRFHHAFILLYL